MTLHLGNEHEDDEGRREDQRGHDDDPQHTRPQGAHQAPTSIRKSSAGADSTLIGVTFPSRSDYRGIVVNIRLSGFRKSPLAPARLSTLLKPYAIRH